MNASLRLRRPPVWARLALVAVIAVALTDGGDDTSAPVSTSERAAEAESPPARAPAPTARPEPAPEPARAPTAAPSEAAQRNAEPEDGPGPPAWTVARVVDGDTVEVRSSHGEVEQVRIIGIDTPERGECGFADAADALDDLVGDRPVDLVGGARDDRDRYDRMLRYVDVDGVDAGLALVEAGLAVPRYDSRDGYGHHTREAAYVAAGAAASPLCAAAAPPAPRPAASMSPAAGGGPGTGPGGAWRNCTEARSHGAAPVRRGDPGFGSHLDGDDDGVGCES